MNDQNFDVIVVGGGPAGSTMSALLAQKGRQVLMLEKEHHPRFHIGESLLPMNLPILDRLGVGEKVKEIGVVKHGAEFTIQNGKKPQTFNFRDAWRKEPTHAYQVRRSEFDEMLFRNAADKGARTLEGVKVTDVERSGEGYIVRGVGDDGAQHEWSCRFLVDASGRDTFMSRRLSLKQKNPDHNSAAVFGHFENVQMREGEARGNITISWFDHGWFWMIPLRDGTMSVGAVCLPEYLKTRDCSPEDFLWRTIALCPEVEARMRDAKLVSKVNATGNYSYTSKTAYGDRFVMIGDAFAFVDPVFSSGVYLAMSGAERACTVVDEILSHPEKERALLEEYEAFIRAGTNVFCWFIYRFNTPAMRKLFMKPSNTFRIQEAVTSVLAGDVYTNQEIRRPLAMFRIVYAVVSAWVLPKTLLTRRRLRRNAALRFEGGTTSVDEA